MSEHADGDIDAAGDSNVRSLRYFVARTVTSCPRCAHSTPVCGVFLPDGHDVLVPEDAGDTWEPAHSGAFVFYVTRLNQSAIVRLQAAVPGFRQARNEAMAIDHWVNSCARCGGSIEDHDLYCEPDGAFLPTSAAAAARIELTGVDEDFEANVGGFSDVTDFLDHMAFG